MTRKRGRGWATRIAGAALLIALYVFMFAPLIVVAGASFGSGERVFVSFPPEQFSLEWYWRIPKRFYETLGVSLALAIATAVCATALAVPAALALVRGRFRGREAFDVLLRAPLQIPFVVTGIAFLQLYYLIGGAIGLYLQGSFAGLLLGHLFLTTPYAIGTVSAVLKRFNPRYEEAAASLGATRARVFRRVTLPMIMPGIYAGALYAFIVSFGEVPVALFLSGSAYTTFPVEMFASMQFDFNPSLLSISTLILVFSLILLIVLQRMVGLDTLLRAGAGR